MSLEHQQVGIVCCDADDSGITPATLAQLKLPSILTHMEHDTTHDPIIKIIRKEYGQHARQTQRQSVFERKEFIEQDPNKLLVG